MKLSKEQFIRYVNNYKRMSKEESEVIDALDVCPDWRPSGWVNSYYDLLSDMCELKEDPRYGTTLDWFCWETEFGKRADMRVIQMSDETSWDITNAGILYDYLMKYEVEE